MIPTMPKVSCPRCKLTAEYSADNPYRPFCSERCKMIDLGKWANEEYNIASEEPLNRGEEHAEALDNYEKALLPRDRRH